MKKLLAVDAVNSPQAFMLGKKLILQNTASRSRTACRRKPAFEVFADRLIDR